MVVSLSKEEVVVVVVGRDVTAIVVVRMTLGFPGPKL